MRGWLVATVLAVAAAIAVGGVTRLTEAGLSITEWKPVTGIIPPLGEAEWADAFQRYQQIPEAQTVHRGISLEAFKRLFWWEWFHRLLARGVGLVIVVPFLVLLLKRRIPTELHLRLANIPLLTGLQGFVGWYMVRSGLTDRTDVSQYRLVMHLGIALLILSIAVATLAQLDRGIAAGSPPARPRWMLPGLAALSFVTMLSGGFVAGLDAGFIYNTFPLMGDSLVPEGYGAITGWRNAFENPVAAQFHHRILAVVTGTGTIAAWVYCVRTRQEHGIRRITGIAAAVAVLQVGLGIATLLLAVPVPLGVMHQLGGVALLGTLVGAAARERRREAGGSEG